MSKRKKPKPPRPLLPVNVLVSDASSQRRSERPTPTEYPLSRALFFYGRRLTNEDDDIPHLAMIHDVASNGDLGPGRPINPVKFAQTIYRLKKGEILEPLFLCPGNVLAENREVILWWEPASVRPMWFKTAEPIPQLSAMNGKSVPHPPLLFRVGKGDGALLSVWAMLTNERPNAATPLYHAPYCNRYPDGSMCMGTSRDRTLTKIKKTGPSDWMELFFDSNFSHTPPPLNYGKDNSKEAVHPASEIHAAGPSAIAARRARLVNYASFLRTLSESEFKNQPALALEKHYAPALIPCHQTVASVLKAPL